MLRHRLRWASQVAFWIAAGCLLAFGILGVVRLAQAAPSEATAQRLDIATAVSGVAALVVAIIGVVLAYRQGRPHQPDVSNLTTSKLQPTDSLINRDAEMRDLVTRLDEHQVVGCHGPRGAGKTFLLKHLADVINGNRHPVRGQPKPKRVSAALYFNLAAATGFTDACSQICGEALQDSGGLWSDFVAYVNHQFQHRNVILILDNMNSPGLWRELGEHVYTYLADRKKDKVLLGSIDPVVLGNQDVQHVPVQGLNLPAAKELVARRGVSMTCDELAVLHAECRGLPLYLRVLSTYDGKTRSGRGTAVIDEQLIPELPAETRRLLSYASLTGLMERQISRSELAQFPLAHLDDQLEIVENRTLVTAVPGSDDRYFEIHDILRDTALRVLAFEVADAAGVLFEREYARGEFEHAALFAMFSDPAKLGAERLDDLFATVIRTAVDARNYAFLGNLYARAHEHTDLLLFITGDQARTDLFRFARASELAGLGRYEQAEVELHSSSIVRARLSPDRDDTELQTDLRFLQADIAHLLNRYDESAQMFADLGRWAEKRRRDALHALCLWGQAHVLRHQGRNLEEAMSLFERATVLSEANGQLFTRVKAITGATGIKVLVGDVPDDEEELLASLEQEIATSSTHDGHMLEIWKYQAQVAWLRGRREDAATIIESAIRRALALNDRLLYNLYFERAEYARFEGDFASALHDYGRVLNFGEENRDRNLIANALLGNVLVALQMGTWADDLPRTDALSSSIRAREIAIQAEIAITAELAERIVGMLDAPASASDPIRLIVL